MPHDELWLGVVSGFLMQAFDGGHLLPLFWHFQTICGKEDKPLFGNRIEETQCQFDPELEQPREVESVGMEEV
jgi:hypothetical protein